MDMPPSRYKVVEEGRRLVVIDRMTGEAVRRQTPVPASRARPSASPLPPAYAAWTGSRFRTMRFFDAKGPRTLVIDAAGVRRLAVARNYGIVVVALAFFLGMAFPWIAVVPLFLLLHDGTRKPLRNAVTRWLDQFAQADSSTG